MRALILAGALGLGLLGSVALAGETDGAACPVPGADKAAATTQPTGAPINKFCPVMRNNPVDPNVTLVYEGKVIGFCCKGCPAVFLKDPAKYMKDLK
jgi:hypothetical protein